MPRTTMLSRWACSCLLLFPVLPAPARATPAPPQDLVALRSWNQAHGNAAGTSGVDVEPVVVAPQELWRLSIGPISGTPAIWGERIFVLVRERRSLRLHVLDATAGTVVCSYGLGHGEQGWVAAWQGHVAVAAGDSVQLFVLRKERLLRKKSFRGQSWPEPALHGRWLYGNDSEGRLHVVDVERARLLGDGVPGGVGRPSAGPWGVAVVARARQPAGGYRMQVRIYPAPGEADREWVPEGRAWWGIAPELARTESPGVILPFAFPSGGWDTEDPARSLRWYVACGRRLAARSGREHPAAIWPGSRLSPIVDPPIAFGGALIGWDEKGELLYQGASGSWQRALVEGGMPPGARPGPPTRARGVGYMGNFAMDLAAGQVLWCLPELDLAGPLVPLTDGTVLGWNAAGELFALGAPRRPAAAVAGAEPPPLPAGSAPDAVAEGCILVDGRVIAGRPAAADEEVAARIRDDGLELLGEPWAVYLAWAGALEREGLDALRPLFEEYRDRRLLDDCRRLLRELEEWGLPAAEREAWLRSLAGLRERKAANLEAQRQHLREREKEVRAGLRERHKAAADWCAARGLPKVATVLLARAMVWLAGEEPDQERLRAWMPAEFPQARDSDAELQWLRWAVELLPAGATFLPADDPAWEDVADTTWAVTSVALRTRHLLLFSRTMDPQAVGICLRAGEGAVRVLDRYLGPVSGGGETEAGAAAPMQVRLFASRGDFLAQSAVQDLDLSWSAGYYKPEDRLSRFYPPGAGQGAVYQRGLEQVVIHELTHQYCSERAFPGGQLDWDRPIHWLAEGYATFLEEQALELGRRRQGLDDATVPSVDLCAVLRAQRGGEALFSLAELLAVDAKGFAALEVEPGEAVRLRYRAEIHRPSRRTLFYFQSGALCFFLWNRAGESGRKGLLECLRLAYHGELPEDPGEVARVLGYPDLGSLEAAFLAFLDEEAGRAGGEEQDATGAVEEEEPDSPGRS